MGKEITIEKVDNGYVMRVNDGMSSWRNSKVYKEEELNQCFLEILQIFGLEEPTIDFDTTAMENLVRWR